MKSFEAMGEAQLQAARGQQMLAAALARSLGRLMARVLDVVARHLPESKATPW